MTSSDYIVAIPSYKRAELCAAKTLAMLKKNHVTKDKINVYVANDEEYKTYKETLDPSTYGKLIVGVKGLVPQRQFIMDHQPTNKHIVFFDDDVESVDLSLSKFKGESLDHFFQEAFKTTKEHGAYMWGVYPVFNPYFRTARKEVTTCLTYIVGAFYGVINRPDNKNLKLTLTAENGQKEDVERTIKYFKEDGVVIRFNRVGFITKYYGKTGGLGTFDERLKPMKDASDLLKKTYPEYGDVVSKKTGMTEFRLKKLPSRAEAKAKAVTAKATKTTRKTRKL
jgi:hypothetical protein